MRPPDASITMAPATPDSIEVYTRAVRGLDVRPAEIVRDAALERASRADLVMEGARHQRHHDRGRETDPEHHEKGRLQNRMPVHDAVCPRKEAICLLPRRSNRKGRT